MNALDILMILIPEHNNSELIISLILCLGLAFAAYWLRILDAYGSIASFIIGLIIAVFANIYWLITLICFLIVTYIVTIIDFKYKQNQGVAQGRHGERGLRSVLANGSLLAIIAVFRFQLGFPVAGLLFITSICVAASDSFANEIGVLSNRTYLITHLHKRVRPGTNGGVSILGEGAAVLGALIPALIGWLIISEFNNDILQITTQAQMPMTYYTLIFPISIGFLGCQIDSILGATLQRQGIITNDDVNFLSILLCILIALVIILLFPI
jgi:uncharacterized protein (TIGR00297 family)